MRAFLLGPYGNLPVPAGSNILGRGQDCSLRIDDPRLSRHHARLLHDGSSLIIEDIGSTNGVLVNGERILGKKHLGSGDTVVCGPCVFTIALDPTQKASASELLPGTGRKQDPHETEAMDPLELPGSDRLPTSQPARQLNPQIAAAVSSDEASDLSSDVLKPNEEAHIKTSVLIHRSDTTPRGNPLPPPSTFASERETRDRKDKTTGLIPNDFTPTGSLALQPDFVTPAASGPASIWKRCFAGIADSLTLVLLMAVLALPLVVGGYGWALTQAGAIVEQDLPQLTSTPTSGAGAWSMITSLLRPDGWNRAIDISGRLMRADDQQPFLILFAATSLGVLFALVGAIIHLIGATVVHGAPYWHRKVGIEIVEARTGYLLIWGRAVARWFAFLVLWPLAPIAMALKKRSLHDVLTGCAVRGKRR